MLSTHRQTNQRYQKHNLLCQGGNKQSPVLLVLAGTRMKHTGVLAIDNYLGSSLELES